ncbi:beta-lactamase family protein [Microlunatus elymi]|uniref:Beta-lactamase family protein n=1 Tax=Microlunatus elymi TaxID=2596828 RepID=A0A516PUB0_9ACTN|nr:serine hydrolase domain-containing protein [Microlunatus elymi]QDP94778.1 beta-lactamase family protein [Microlunatus elymi]
MDYHKDRIELTRAAVEELFASRVIERDGAPAVTPSTVYAVFDRSGIRYGAGFGDLGDVRTPTLRTAYRIASCTKSFTAAALMIIVERGLVALDDPVDRYLQLGPLIGPDGTGAFPVLRQAQDPSGGVGVSAPTLRQLAAMAGGLPTDDPWADRQESLSSRAFRELLAAGIRFVAEPGERYEYSNLGFAMLGAVIETVTGRDYIGFVTDELIKPLGLTGIGYSDDLAGVDGVAVGHRRTGGEWEALPFSAPGAFSPIGGVFASAAGLVDWIGWLSAAFDRGDDHDQPLGRLSRQLMQSIQTPYENNPGHHGYGLGLVVQEHPTHGRIVAHSGGYPGFGAHMRWHADSGIGVLAFENARYSQPMRPTTQALELILDEIARPGAEPSLWPETAAARLSIERLLRDWDDATAEKIFADNVALDEPMDRRRREIAELVAEVDLDDEVLPLLESAPSSRTPAQLSWTVPGGNGSLRCEISLNPANPPKVQRLVVRRG